LSVLRPGPIKYDAELMPGTASLSREARFTPTVLIVDDHAFVRAALRGFLERAHLLVADEAQNGPEAIQKAKDLKPDLILMNLSMPQMSGVEASSVIRAALPDTRIILFTMYSEAIGGSMAKAAGVDLVIPKADGTAALSDAIRRLLPEHFPDDPDRSGA